MNMFLYLLTLGPCNNYVGKMMRKGVKTCFCTCLLIVTQDLVKVQCIETAVASAVWHRSRKLAQK